MWILDEMTQLYKYWYGMTLIYITKKNIMRRTTYTLCSKTEMHTHTYTYAHIHIQTWLHFLKTMLISQERISENVPGGPVVKTSPSNPRGMSSIPGQGTKFPCASAAKSPESCPTLCDPIDSSPPGSTVPGILQARILEWVATSFSNTWKWKLRIQLPMPEMQGTWVHSLGQEDPFE